MQYASNRTCQCSSPTFTYINCKGNHTEKDKQCPSYFRKIQFQKYKSQQHLTIQEAQCQFQFQKKSVATQYAMTAAHPPVEMVTRSEFESTISQLLLKFTNTLEMGPNEMQSLIHSLLVFITTPLVQEVHGSKVGSDGVK